MPSPLISIGIPTLNRSSYLMQALRSALAQTYPNIEVIVSDNASSDDTVARVRELADPRVHLSQQSVNIGLIANFNSCLDNASGEFFLMLSDDDVLAPTAIEKLARCFVEPTTALPAQSIGAAWCPCRIIDGEGQPMWNTDPGPALETSVDFICALFLGKRGPRLASVLVRTEDARSVGRYSHDFGDLCDTANWGQVTLHYLNSVCVPEFLVDYRVHAKAGTAARNITAEQSPEARLAASSALAKKCQIWQQWGEAMLNAFIAIVRENGDDAGVNKLNAVRSQLLANLTVDVLMRGKGQPGWLNDVLREFRRVPGILITPYVGNRLFREGWKLLRLN